MADAKRARIVAAKAFTGVKLEGFTLRFTDDRKGGKFVNLLLDGDHPRINVTPSGSLKLVCGFDMLGNVEKTSFNSDAKAKASEHLTVRVDLNQELEDWLNLLDDKISGEYAKEDAESKWQPLVKQWSTLGQVAEFPTVRVQVGLTGECTALKICDEADASVQVAGQGWEFLSGEAARRHQRCRFYGAAAKMVLRPKVWKLDGKAGLALFATQMVLKPVVFEKVEELDAFVDATDF